MTETLISRLSDWNRRMNGIPRKCLLIAITLFCAWLAISLFPYCWPFIVALAFSMILEPFVRLITKGLQRLKMRRSVATLLGMLLLFGVVAAILGFTINRLWRELMALVRAIPGVVSWLTGTGIPWVQDLYRQYQDILPPYALDLVDNSIRSLGQTLGSVATSLSKTLTSGAWATAMSLVDVILSIVMTIMGTYYLTADKSRIMSFFRRTFPKDVISHSTLIKTNLMHSLFGQIKSQLTVTMIIITFLALAFMIFGAPYGLLAGLVIGIADALPVIGAGLFLIPWSIFSFVTGNVPLGIFLACAYVGTVAIRQIFEPRIVGRNLGLYPLATMITMYAGYQLLGFLGLLAGPILLNVIKVVLAADKAAFSSSQEDEAAAATPDAEPGDPALTSMPKADGELTLPNGKKRKFRIRGR